ncbi:MAG: hypothetical protein WCQ87_08840 [Parabacteroides sp.]
MNPDTYKSTILVKIEDCKKKSAYYKSFTDTVTAALWQGKKEAHEEDLKMFEEIENGDIQPVKTTSRRSK